MRERAQVRPDGDRWTATLPRFGFGPPARRTFDSQHEACTWARRCLDRGTGALAMVDAERLPALADGVAEVPVWTPLRRAVWT
ncbi:hypothetical protein ACWEFJ_28370 [Actinosynnema sp. NPDC004786]